MRRGRSKRNVTLESLATMVKGGFDDVDRRFGEMHRRFDRLEKLILADHKRRIERLEEEMKELKELLRVP